MGDDYGTGKEDLPCRPTIVGQARASGNAISARKAPNSAESPVRSVTPDSLWSVRVRGGALAM